MNSHFKNDFHGNSVTEVRALIVRVEQKKEDIVQQYNSATASER